MASPRPALVIVGGINGCGKSTFAIAAIKDNPHLFLGQTAINPDAITQEVKGRLEGIAEDAANYVAVEKAEKLAWRAIAEGKSIAIETVLSSDKFLPLVVAARKRRYRTRLVFIGVPTVELAYSRVQQRINLGGHAVPLESIKNRWNRTHDNLVRFVDLVDDILVYSNAGTQPKLIADRIGRNGQLRFYDITELPAVAERFGLTAERIALPKASSR